jgi:hypothetical protein
MTELMERLISYGSASAESVKQAAREIDAAQEAARTS